MVLNSYTLCGIVGATKDRNEGTGYFDVQPSAVFPSFSVSTGLDGAENEIARGTCANLSPVKSLTICSMYFSLSEGMGMEVFSGRVYAEKLKYWGVGCFCSQPFLVSGTSAMIFGADGAVNEEALLGTCASLLTPAKSLTIWYI